MEQTFLTDIEIKKVRHLENISIPLDKNKRKHLILTGKNGSGKTSVLEELVQHFTYILSDSFDSYDELREKQRFYIDRMKEAEKIFDLEKRSKSIQEEKKC